MRNGRFSWFSIPLTALAVWGSATIAQAEAFGPQERAAFEAKLRVKQAPVRLQAVQALAGFQRPEAVEVLIHHGLHDADDEVRRAAYDGLLASRYVPRVCVYLVEQLNRESRRKRHDPCAPLLLAALLSSELGDVQMSAQTFLDQRLAKARDGGMFVIALADLLAVHRAPADVAPLARLLRSKVSEPFAVRRALVGALARIDDAAAVDTLITALPKIDGELRAEMVEYLALVTKQPLADPKAWQEWWAKNREGFVFPRNFERPPARKFENLVSGSFASYYGLPLYARRLVFVVDASGSMQGQRIVQAKQELMAAISLLQEEVSFNIVSFNWDPISWQANLVPADPRHKALAMQFVRDIEPRWDTCTYDAMAAAMQFNAEAVYLLTDGAPTKGTIVAPPEIVAAISASNHLRRESIYTIGIAPGEEDGPFELFLKELAGRNYGLYRRVEE